MAATTSAFSSRLRSPFVGLLAGLLSGLGNAVIARILMRIVALSAGGRGNFSVGGTLNIFLIAALLGPLLGVCYAGLRRWLPGRGAIRGLIFGLILLVMLQGPILMIVPEFRAEIMAVGTLGIAVFVLINLCFSVGLGVVEAQVDRTWPTDDSRRTTMQVGIVVLGLLALAGLGLLLYQLGGRMLGLVD